MRKRLLALVMTASILAAFRGAAPQAVAQAPDTETALARFHRAYEAANKARRKVKIKAVLKSELSIRKWGIPEVLERRTNRDDIRQRRRGPDSRPVFYEPRARAAYEPYLWDGHLDSFNPLGADRLTSADDYALQEAALDESGGERLVRMIFLSTPRSDDQSRITAWVREETFEPVKVEHVLREPYRAPGVVLREYRLTLDIKPSDGLWLIVRGEENYSYFEALPTQPVRVSHLWETLFEEASPLK